MIGGPLERKIFFSGGVCKVWFYDDDLKVDLGLAYSYWFFMELIANLPTDEQYSQQNHFIHEKYWNSILEWCLALKKSCWE